MRAKLIREVGRLRGTAVWPRDKELTVRIILKSGILAGLPVQYRHRRCSIVLTGVALWRCHPQCMHCCYCMLPSAAQKVCMVMLHRVQPLI